MSRTAPDDRDQFHLEGAWNFRDLGGLRTRDGSVTRGGVLLRSSALTHLTDAGQRTLGDLGVAHVFDFRSSAEVRRYGSDRAPDGIRVHAVPYALERTDADAAPDDGPQRPSSAREYLDTAYRAFPTLPGARIAIASVIDVVATGSSPALVHCAAGKDRAGWTVATVLRAAGVAEEDILADYLRSNDAVDPLRRHIETHSDEPPTELPVDLLGVREEYYRAGWEAMTLAHGSFEGYLDWLGIGRDTLDALRTVLVAPPG